MIKHREYHQNLGGFPIRYNLDGKKICQICDKLLSPRQTKYCSSACQHTMLIKHSHNFLKMEVVKKRGRRCEKCGICDTSLILDHKIPIAIGGDEFSEDNVWLLCHKCNKEKTRLDMLNISIERRIPTTQMRLGIKTTEPEDDGNVEKLHYASSSK